MKFISEYGNEIIITENRNKIRWLKTLGFRHMEETEQLRPIRTKKGAGNGDQKETK